MWFQNSVELIDLDFIADCEILHRSLTTKIPLLYLFGWSVLLKHVVEILAALKSDSN